MTPIAERWECRACERLESTGGALPRGWRYVRRGSAIVTVCDVCSALAQRRAEDAYRRTLWGDDAEG